MTPRKLVEFNIFSIKDSTSSETSQTRSISKKTRLTKPNTKKFKLGSSAAIEAKGMSSCLVEKFQKGISISYEMIIQEINKNIQLKVDIWELKRLLKKAKRQVVFRKYIRLKKL